MVLVGVDAPQVLHNEWVLVGVAVVWVSISVAGGVVGPLGCAPQPGMAVIQPGGLLWRVRRSSARFGIRVRLS